MSDRPNLALVPSPSSSDAPRQLPLAPETSLAVVAEPGVAPPPAPRVAPIPPFLQPPPTDHPTPLGTVKLNGESWIIEAEPHVTEMAKRLFHGSRGLGRGRASIPATKRTIGDLNWLLLRYPLVIRDEDRQAYQRMLVSAQEHVDMLVRAQTAPDAIAPKMLLTLKPYQERGVAHLVNNRRTLLADTVGLGKTAQAIGFLVHTQSWPALVVAPPHLVLNWAGKWGGADFPGEIEKFLGRGCTVAVLRGQKAKAPLPLAHVYVMPYHLLTHWREVLRAAKIGTVIFDEIQELRHHETAKYSAASEIASLAENIIGLSGTPIHNYGSEMWAVLNILEFNCLGNREAFTREYCTHYNGKMVSDPEVLRAHLEREGLMLRRRAEDVIADLPPKRRVTQQIGMDGDLYAPLIEQAVAAAMAVKDAKDSFNAKRLRQIAIEHSRQAIGVAKAPYVAAFVHALLEADEKVLLFGHHHAAFKEYTERLAQWNPVEISGRVKDARDKKKAEGMFQNGETNLCIMGMRAGSGLNMTRATVVVFGELDWSPAIHAQNEGRAADGLRAVGKSSVLIYYLVAPEGSDREVLDHLGLKVQQFVGIMGDKPETEEDKMLAAQSAEQHMEALLGRLQQMGKTPKKMVQQKLIDEEPPPVTDDDGSGTTGAEV